MKSKILCIVSFCVCISFGGCEEIKEMIPDRLTPEEIVAGLRAALNKGSEMASVHAFGSELSDVKGGGDGFLNNKYIDISIPLPAELNPMLSAINDVPADVWTAVKLVLPEYDFPARFNELFRAMNIAAAIAAKGSFNAFVPVIRDMDIREGINILNSSNNTAATDYLFTEADDDLRITFKTVIDKVFKDDLNVMAQFWTPLATSYNKLQNTINSPLLRPGLELALGKETVSYLSFGGSAIETDLEPYIATKAIDGLKKLVAREETLIRSNPNSYAEDIIRRVFGHKDE